MPPLDPAPADLTPAALATAIADTPLPDAAERAALHAALAALKRQTLLLVRGRHERSLQLVGHNEIAALNAQLRRVARLNLALRDYRRSSRVAGWPDPPLPTNCLMSPADLLPALEVALDVLAVAGARLHG